MQAVCSDDHFRCMKENEEEEKEKKITCTLNMTIYKQEGRGKEHTPQSILLSNIPGYTIPHRTNPKTPHLRYLCPFPIQYAYLIHAIASTLNDTLPGQELRNHEMAHVFIGPVRKMGSDASPKGDIEKAPTRKKVISTAHMQHYWLKQRWGQGHSLQLLTLGR